MDHELQAAAVHGGSAQGTVDNDGEASVGSLVFHGQDGVDLAVRGAMRLAQVQALSGTKYRVVVAGNGLGDFVRRRVGRATLRRQSE